MRSMVAIREDTDDVDDLEFHDSYDVAEAPTWATMEEEIDH